MEWNYKQKNSSFSNGREFLRAAIHAVTETTVSWAVVHAGGQITAIISTCA
jgi:hypothetical protein